MMVITMVIKKPFTIVLPTLITMKFTTTMWVNGDNVIHHH
jgi:hypothetical protein